jgi:hypothetical protein
VTPLHVIVNILHIAVDILHINVGDSVWNLFSWLLYNSPSTNGVMKETIMRLDDCELLIWRYVRRSSRGLCKAMFRHSCRINGENNLKLQPGLAVSLAWVEPAASKIWFRHVIASPSILVTKVNQNKFQNFTSKNLLKVIRISHAVLHFVPKDRRLTAYQIFRLSGIENS